ncbi:MAG: NlpC/P60 family protein [Coriobacteriia bacterium]
MTAAQKAAEARKIKTQVDALNTQVEIAQENYDVAASKHAALLAQAEEAQAKVDAAEAKLATLQDRLGTRANRMYRSGGTSFLDVLLGASSFEEFSATWDFLKQLNATDADYIEQTKEARAEAEAAHAELDAKEKAAAEQVAIMKKNKSSAEKDLAKAQNLLKGVEAEVAALRAAEEAERERQASKWQASTKSGEKTYPAPTRAPRSEVINIARKYLGAPYRWGAAGPNAFDCSGFTMFVYSQVGVSLPHSSSAQYGCGERVSRADLEPGDLVFFGSPIHHVGIYVGGGMMIHAPHSGDVVKIAPISSNYVGACRP